MSAPESIVPAIKSSLRFFAVTEIATRPVRALPFVAFGLGLLLAGQAVADVTGADGQANTFFNHGVHNFLLAAAAAACVVRAFVVDRGRMAWLMFGLSLAAFAV